MNEKIDKRLRLLESVSKGRIFKESTNNINLIVRSILDEIKILNNMITTYDICKERVIFLERLYKSLQKIENNVIENESIDTIVICELFTIKGEIENRLLFSKQILEVYRLSSIIDEIIN